MSSGFSFDDIIKMEDRSIQQFLRAVDTEELAQSLKNTNKDLQNAIFRNMS